MNLRHRQITALLLALLGGFGLFFIGQHRDDDPIVTVAPSSPLTCLVTRVVDGDTIRVQCADGEKTVRLLHINTPEYGEPGFGPAREALGRMVGGRQVTLTIASGQSRDRYGRLLAYVYVDGVCANVEMVRAGWSVYWTKYGPSPMAEDFEQAEREARRHKRRGGWHRKSRPQFRNDLVNKDGGVAGDADGGDVVFWWREVDDAAG